MNKNLFLALLASAIGMFASGCQTHSTARANLAPQLQPVAAEISAQELFGGYVGEQVVATYQPRFETAQPKALVADLDHRAYLIWKQSTKS